MREVRKLCLVKRLLHLEILFRSWPAWSSDFGSDGGVICIGLSRGVCDDVLPFNRSFWKRRNIDRFSSLCASPLCEVASILGLLEGDGLSLGDCILLRCRFCFVSFRIIVRRTNLFVRYRKNQRTETWKHVQDQNFEPTTNHNTTVHGKFPTRQYKQTHFLAEYNVRFTA